MLLNTLKSDVPSSLETLVLELFEEIKDYFFKMDLYFHYNKNSFLFDAIYSKGVTNIDISLTLPLDTKCITKFIKDAEELTENIICTFPKYKNLIPYAYKK